MLEFNGSQDENRWIMTLLFVNSNEHGHNILDLIQEIEGYIEENF